MYTFQHVGHSSVRFVGSIRLFFSFVGHLSISALQVISGKLSIYWFNVGKTIFRSGAHLMLPIMMISALLGMSVAISLYDILSEFRMQHDALAITQNVLIHNVVPFLIGFILSIQSGLNLINARVKRLHRMPQEVMLEYILPIMIGIMIAGTLLYIYAMAAFFISVYFTYHYILNAHDLDYLLHITKTLTAYDLGYSIFKSILYCWIVALVVGYYYYEVALRSVSLRRAVSNIMTRSLLWIIMISAYLDFFKA